MVSILFVGIGGFLGAASRYAVSRLSFVHKHDFPVATLFVNTLGSFALGILYSCSIYQLPLNKNIMYFLGTGMLGSFTTFSTFSVESLQLIKSGKRFIFILYISLSILLSLLGAAAGFLAVRMISSAGN
ncbi:MAG: fluoride efflux transporter CrcB [Desulfotomaculum sp.]|nr:fluoride efflux transporter CrcB [Desulfotomaculum sp.]